MLGQAGPGRGRIWGSEQQAAPWQRFARAARASNRLRPPSRPGHTSTSRDNEKIVPEPAAVAPGRQRLPARRRRHRLDGCGGESEAAKELTAGRALERPTGRLPKNNNKRDAGDGAMMSAIGTSSPWTQPAGRRRRRPSAQPIGSRPRRAATCCARRTARRAARAQLARRQDRPPVDSIFIPSRSASPCPPP